MSSSRPRTLVDAAVVRRARQLLDHQLAEVSEDDPARAQLLEAMLWIDRGVYGRCSVCGECLSRAQVLSKPADKVCAACHQIARSCRARVRHESRDERMNQT
jgi:RNA polymerase-binding transcription factor DksA